MSEDVSKTDSTKTYYCPSCKKPLRRIEGKMGPFWGCSSFPECHTTLNDLQGKPSTQIDEHYRCPICTRKLVKSEKAKGKGTEKEKYWFCSGYSKGCKVTLADKDGVPEAAYRCLKCGHLLVKRKGKNGVFWGCSSYPECTASYQDKDLKPDFDLFTAKHS